MVISVFINNVNEIYIDKIQKSYVKKVTNSIPIIRYKNPHVYSP